MLVERGLNVQSCVVSYIKGPGKSSPLAIWEVKHFDGKVLGFLTKSCSLYTGPVLEILIADIGKMNKCGHYENPITMTLNRDTSKTRVLSTTLHWLCRTSMTPPFIMPAPR